ncbi:MAG: hypothetical protein L6R40_005508 [Gallowayella cf. fulva]|nr:MAG: hypothetical protein L6R40_005508 [Xanthomendoza cf. fulva]
MPHSIPLAYQISLEFLYAYDERTIFRHAYSARYSGWRSPGSEGGGNDGEGYGDADRYEHIVEDISPQETLSRVRMDSAALEHLSILLSGYDLASESWADGTEEKQREVFNVFGTTKDSIRTRPSYWSVSLGSGKPGNEVQGSRPSIDTPFKKAEEMHVCCVKLTSPVFGDSDDEWQSFANSVNKILWRLQKLGSLQPRPRLPSTHRQLAWMNETCQFHITVRPTSERHHISWPALQNALAAWETCAPEIERLTDPQQPPNVFGTTASPDNEGHLDQFTSALYSIPNLSTYLHLTQAHQSTSALSKISLHTDVSAHYCTALRFHQHPSTFSLSQILFWTRLTYTTVLNSQTLASSSRRFEASSHLTGFLHFTNELISDQWVCEHAWSKIWGEDVNVRNARVEALLQRERDEGWEWMDRPTSPAADEFSWGGQQLERDGCIQS